MNLDLDELIGDWNAPDEEVSARVVGGRDGAEVLQLRVDLGLLQMFLDGRPDGSSRDALRTGAAASDELHRELQQYNYRRLALSSLAEEALRKNDLQRAGNYLRRALRDIEHCLSILDEVEGCGEDWEDSLAMLGSTLIFNRARLLANLRAAEGYYDEAIEEAQRGVRELINELDGADADLDCGAPNDNPAIRYLCQLEERLRKQHGISLTLKEKLEHAIEHEDFEAAARLRDELRTRSQSRVQPRLPGPHEAQTQGDSSGSAFE